MRIAGSRGAEAELAELVLCLLREGVESCFGALRGGLVCDRRQKERSYHLDRVVSLLAIGLRNNLELAKVEESLLRDGQIGRGCFGELADAQYQVSLVGLVSFLPCLSQPWLMCSPHQSGVPASLPPTPLPADPGWPVPGRWVRCWGQRFPALIDLDSLFRHLFLLDLIPGQV